MTVALKRLVDSSRISRASVWHLYVKVLLRNHKLAKSIFDVSWSNFVTKLQYKADWYERKIIKIDKMVSFESKLLRMQT